MLNFNYNRFKLIFFRIYNRILIICRLKKINRFEGIINIEMASEILLKHLKYENIDFTNLRHEEFKKNIQQEIENRGLK
jgi:hypothetical protein